MEGLEERLGLEKLVGLEEASNEHSIKTNFLSPFNRLTKEYKLYLGEQFGESSLSRSGYWHNPFTGELLFDYHIFFQNASNSLIIVETHAKKLEGGSYASIDEEAQALGPLTKCIGSITGYLMEILDRYHNKKIDMNGKTLNISNSTMYEDLGLLAMGVFLLGDALRRRAEAPQDEQTKDTLVAKTKDLMKSYNRIKAEYEKG